MLRGAGLQAIWRTGLLSALALALGGCDLLSNAQFMERFQSRPQPQASLPLSEQGIGNLAKGDLLQAGALFDRALQSNPRDVHALLGKGMIHQQTGQLAQAQAAYEAVIALRPNNSQKMIVMNNLDPQPVLELASLNLALLQNRGLSSSLAANQQPHARTMGPMIMPAQKTQTRRAVGNRAQRSEPTPSNMVSAEDKNIIERFETIKKLMDEGLITEAEYNARRKANLGALLYLTQQPPAVGLERSVPSAAQITQRLNAIRRALEMRAITVRQHGAERNTIVEGLLPATPRVKANPRPAPKGLLASADATRRIEMLQERGIVTDAEAMAEKAAIEKALYPSQPKPAPKPADAAQAKASSKPAAMLSGPQPAVHIASFRSRKAADRGWAQLRRAHRSLLANLQPEIMRVNLGRGKGVFYRLVAGPLKNDADVKRVCLKLKSRRQYCEPAFMAGG
ncbi:MAG: hypothetical protein CBD27_07445 [Rhodospirillaceae bacterium TMED167]|nr:hypothetical protein [Rhodospirillaceae bacterium]OUW26846.1 MAG: hypothetical protein CBD27_07445 [Rhodospirillaceae bacterium TMED167]